MKSYQLAHPTNELEGFVDAEARDKWLRNKFAQQLLDNGRWEIVECKTTQCVIIREVFKKPPLYCYDPVTEEVTMVDESEN